MKRTEHNILRVYDQATADELRQGLEWYSNAHAQAALLHADIRVGAAIIAALSPGLRWEKNVEAARRVIAGESLEGLGVRWPDGVAKAKRILAGENPAVVLKGNKVRAFWQCILNPDNVLHVCIDGHAYSIWRGKRIPVNATPEIADRAYVKISSDYVQAARAVGITPARLQAITWIVWRRLHGADKPGRKAA